MLLSFLHYPLITCLPKITECIPELEIIGITPIKTPDELGVLDGVPLGVPDGVEDCVELFVELGVEEGVEERVELGVLDGV